MCSLTKAISGLVSFVILIFAIFIYWEDILPIAKQIFTKIYYGLRKR